MKRTKLYVLVIVALLLIGATYAVAASEGDSNFRTRYNTTSSTPITDINYLNGVTSNVQTQLDAKTSSSLADTKVNVGQATGLAAAKSVSLTGDVTGTMANTGAIATQIAANSVSATEIADNTITATQIAANAVAASELYLTTTSIPIAAAASNAAAAITASSVILGAYPFANVNDADNEMINSVSITAGYIHLVVNGTVAGDTAVYKVVTVAP